MPSPVKPSDFCSLAPTPSTSACESIKRLFFAFPLLLCDLVAYIFDEDGNVTDEFKSDNRQIPAGTVFEFAGVTPPAGFLPCDGRQVSRTEYETLFAAIGTLWGDGDGSTTFSLPNFSKRTSIGPDSAHSIGSTGGVPDTAVLDHTHVMGRFNQKDKDNVYLKTQEIVSPETFTGRYISGQRDQNNQTTVEEDQTLNGPNEANSGAVTTIPVEKTSLTDGNMMPYVVILKIIKT